MRISYCGFYFTTQKLRLPAFILLRSTDENMDQTIKPINSSSSETDHLIMLLDKHCKEAEQLALETVAGMDMPFLNPARGLTKGECLQILEKHRDILKIVDQALVLSCLTDYIACASQNELFDTFRKKNDRNALPALLIRLDGQWLRFFHKLGQYDLTHAQLKSVLYLLRQSIKMLPKAYQKCFFSSALAMGESSLKKLEMPQRSSPVTFPGIVTTHCVTSPKYTAKITRKHMTGHKSDSKVQSCSVKHTNNSRILKAVAVNKTTSKGKQNHCERPTDLRPAASRSAACTTQHTSDFVKLSQVTAVDLGELTKGSLNMPVQKMQAKYSSDITKYILKNGKEPCAEVTQCSKILNVLLTEGKKNQEIWSSSLPAGIDLVTAQKHMTGHKSDSKVQSCSVKHTNDARVLKAVAVNKTTSKGKQNHCERPTDLRPAASRSAACTTQHTSDFVKLSHKVTAVDLGELTKGSLNMPVQKMQTKYSSDITKYILKNGKEPCAEVTQCSKILNVLLTEGKENQEIWSSSSPAGNDLITTLKEPVVCATPQEKSSVVFDLDLPTKKPKMEGKEEVNAFSLMMERSRAGTRKNMKRRSLFQGVRKVV